MSQASIIQPLDPRWRRTRGQKVITGRRERERKKGGKEKKELFLTPVSSSFFLPWLSFAVVVGWEKGGKEEMGGMGGKGGRSNNQGLNIAFVRMFRTDCMEYGKKEDGGGEREEECHRLIHLRYVDLFSYFRNLFIGLKVLGR